MIGDKLYKNNKEDMAKYTATAKWCNANNAHIEDKGSYYEVCENVVPEPTTEEKINALDSQYNHDKATLMSQYTEADMIEDFEMKAQIKVELATLQAEYDREYEDIINA